MDAGEVIDLFVVEKRCLELFGLTNFSGGIVCRFSHTLYRIPHCVLRNLQLAFIVSLTRVPHSGIG